MNLDSKEYRYHYIKIDKKELEQSIISYMESFAKKMNDSEESLIFGDLLYATNDSLIGKSGDSYYNCNFVKHVRYLSEHFPKVTFMAGWINYEDIQDKCEFMVKEGIVINNKDVVNQKDCFNWKSLMYVSGKPTEVNVTGNGKDYRVIHCICGEDVNFVNENELIDGKIICDNCGLVYEPGETF